MRSGRARRLVRSLPGSERERGPALLALLATTAAALLVRLLYLGWRIAHQDEARVADWTLHYMQTGVWEYRPIIHGPFLPHTTSVVFAFLGPSDFTMRLLVAVIGGLLPLSAWLFRERLRDSAVVALGLLLAFNPLLLYYSRFFRNDVLTAAFMLVTVGLGVRALDTGKRRYLAGATLTFALAFTTKELALLYPAAWVGAAFLVADQRLVRAVGTGRDWVDTIVGGLRARLDDDTLRRWVPAVLLAPVEFFAVFVFFYAPRTDGLPEPGFWKAFTHPTMWPPVLVEATWGTWTEFVKQWGTSGDHSYLPYFFEFAKDLATGSVPVLAFAALGFLVDRYANERSNALVAFCFYWGAASLVGYPLAADNAFPWEMVHVVVPLTVPAAVGIALVYRQGVRGVVTDDRVAAGAAAVLLVITAGYTGFVAYDTSFANPQSPDNEIVQYAQPTGEMHATLAEIERISRANQGVDVVFYGDLLYSADETWGATEDPPPGWFDRLPLPWYLDTYGATVTSTDSADYFDDHRPPVVIALGAGSIGDPKKTASDVAPRLSGYRRVTHQGYLWDRPVVFFVREDAPGASGSAG